MATANEKFANKITKRLLHISRLESGTAKAALKLFRQLEKELVVELASFAGSSRTKVRLTELLRTVKDLVNPAMDAIEAEVLDDLRSIATAEINAVNAATAEVLQTDVFWITYSPDQINRLVDNTLIQGAPSKLWWARQTSDAKNKFADAVRLGMLRGDDVPTLTQRVKSAIGVSKRNAESLARTSVQTVANTSRQDVYDKSNVVKGTQWRSTLDSKTSTVCMALDGLTWSLPDYKPIGHSISFPGPTAHWQ